MSKQSESEKATGDKGQPRPGQASRLELETLYASVSSQRESKPESDKAGRETNRTREKQS